MPSAYKIFNDVSLEAMKTALLALLITIIRYGFEISKQAEQGQWLLIIATDHSLSFEYGSMINS